MNKNVLILSSSPRRGGNSDRLCDAFLQGCKDAGHTVEKIFLKDKHINYCTGCGICSMYGKPCPQKDDAAEVIEKMIAADVIVMATPVYFYTMSAQMKTLIDRCCARYTEITNKNFYFIVTAAEPSTPALGTRKRAKYLQIKYLALFFFVTCSQIVPIRLHVQYSHQHSNHYYE